MCFVHVLCDCDRSSHVWITVELGWIPWVAGDLVANLFISAFAFGIALFPAWKWDYIWYIVSMSYSSMQLQKCKNKCISFYVCTEAVHCFGVHIITIAMLLCMRTASASLGPSVFKVKYKVETVPIQVVNSCIRCPSHQAQHVLYSSARNALRWLVCIAAIKHSHHALKSD